MILWLLWSFYAAVIAASVGWLRRRGESWTGIFGRMPRRHEWGLILTAWVPLLLVSVGSVALTGALAEGAREQSTATRELLRNLQGTRGLLLFVAFTVLAPVGEELLFRGILLRHWVRRRGFWVGTLGSAALFGLLHGYNALGAFAAGVAFGFAYLASGTLMVPVLMHATYNAVLGIALLGSAAAARAGPAVGTIRQRAPTHAEEASLLLGGLTLVAVLLLTWRVGRRLRAALEAGRLAPSPLAGDQ